MTDREILDTIDDLMIEADAAEDIIAMTNAWYQIRTLLMTERAA